MLFVSSIYHTVEPESRATEKNTSSPLRLSVSAVSLSLHDRIRISSKEAETMLRRKEIAFIFMAIVFVLSGLLQAADVSSLPPKMKSEVETIQKWGADSGFIKAVSDQNAKNVSLDEIKKIDQEWIAAKEGNALTKSLMENKCALHLKELSGQMEDIAEAFVMDNQGALVCLTRKTSDYWQGDEEKWTASFVNGKGAVHVSNAVYDESTKQTLIHVSIPVMQNGKAIGVITVGFTRART